MKLLGIHSGEDLYLFDQNELLSQFGKHGYILYQRVRGIDNRAVEPERERKSIGKEHTFTLFLTDEEQVRVELKQIALAVQGSAPHQQVARAVDCVEDPLRRFRYDNQKENPYRSFFPSGGYFPSCLGTVVGPRHDRTARAFIGDNRNAARPDPLREHSIAIMGHDASVAEIIHYSIIKGR